MRLTILALIGAALAVGCGGSDKHVQTQNRTVVDDDGDVKQETTVTTRDDDGDIEKVQKKDTEIVDD
jgi:hypothetical protein